MSRDVHLHARDLQVLELLGPNCTKKSAYNRLGQLARAGYLEHLLRPDPLPRASHDRRPSEHLYTLGPKAPTALRIRQRSTRKLASAKLPAAFIDHQLAVNRVGDWLNTRLLGEHEASAGLDSRHRPDAAYHAARDEHGHDLILLEVDLGHYSRARILDKAHGFRQHPTARSVLFVCPTDQRAAEVADWLRPRLGNNGHLDRCQVVTFDELKCGVSLEPGTEPAPSLPVTPSWYEHIHGGAGHA